jgi:hypothetical protein
MTPAALEELVALVTQHYPGTPLLRASAKTGQGFDALTQLLEQEGNFGRKILDIDYDTYAEGEAEMGWLNSSVHVAAKQPFALDNLVLELVRRLQQGLKEIGGEVAHLKVIGLGETSFAVANLVSSSTPVELSLASRGQVQGVDVVVNARVAVEPAELERLVVEALTAECATRGATPEFRSTQSLRPGRPTPTHRYPNAV